MKQPHGSLSLPNTIHGAGATAEEEIRKSWNISERVDTELERIGCYPAREPVCDLPELDISVLTTPNSAKFTEAYAARQAWLGLFWEEFAKHEAKLLEIKGEMGDIDLRIRDSMRRSCSTTTKGGTPKGPSAAALKEGVDADPRYGELKRESVFHEQIVKRLGAKIRNLEAAQAVTSRQVEIRRQDWDGTNRGSAIQGRSGIPVSGGQPMRNPLKRHQ